MSAVSAFHFFVLPLLASLALCPLARGTVPDSPSGPYHGIAASNIFRLQPLRVPIPEPPQPPLPRITLTGITSVCDKRAVFKVQFPATPLEPAREQSYILAEGHEDGPIKVLAIDEKGGSVKLNIGGMLVVVTFEKDNSKLAKESPALQRSNARFSSNLTSTK